MLTVGVQLKCDGCDKVFPKSREHRIPVLRKKLEELRGEAHEKGWATYRLTNTGPNGDYCPACVMRHQARERSR